jgi:hypothetical protein
MPRRAVDRQRRCRYADVCRCVDAKSRDIIAAIIELPLFALPPPFSLTPPLLFRHFH